MFLLDPKILILLLTGLINLAMGIFIFLRSPKNKVNLHFGLMTLCNFLWATGLIIFSLALNEWSVRFFASVVYGVAFLVIVSLFYFSINFPYKNFVLPTWSNVVIKILSIAIILYTTVFYKFFVLDINLLPNSKAEYQTLGYTLYTIILIIFVLLSIIILLKKYIKTDGVFKMQLGLVLWGVILGTFFGCYFNLFLMYVDNFNYIHLGPLFTLFINFIVFSFIISSKEKING